MRTLTAESLHRGKTLQGQTFQVKVTHPDANLTEDLVEHVRSFFGAENISELQVEGTTVLVTVTVPSDGVAIGLLDLIGDMPEHFGDEHGLDLEFIQTRS